MKFNTIEELLDYTKGIIGKKFGELDIENKISNGLMDKGILGKIVERGFYGYQNNNIAEADFNNLGVELKVIGYIRNKNGTISAKERLVLSKINYNDIISEEFDFSKLIFKNKKILIIWYEYDYTKSIKDFAITNFQLYDMSSDELIIKNDYEIIKEKIIDGNAHLLSEGDTSFLGACVKAINGEQKVPQPNSEFLAKPRAFSLKNSYLTGILRNLGFSLEVDGLEYKTVEEYVYAQIKNYIGKTQIDIYESIIGELNPENVPKNIGKIISDKLIGTDEELPEKNSLFAKTNYKIKNVPVDKNYIPLERMPFRTIRISEFDDSWDNSEWKNFFEEVTIIALCYEGTKEIANGFRILKNIKKISFSDADIASFGQTYNMVKKAIEMRDVSYLPYPNSFDGQYLEVAPKGQKGANAYDNFFENDKTKVCFMMNKEFIHKKLIENLDSYNDDVNSDDNRSLENNDLIEVKITDYNIFNLFNYNISNVTISLLADKRIPPFNIYTNGMSALDDVDLLDAKKRSLCDAVRNMIHNKDTRRSVFELMYCGISKSTCENLLKKNVTIDIIRNENQDILKEKYGIGNAIAEKIKQCIKDNDLVIAESNNNVDTKMILEQTIIEKTKEGSISIFNLKHLLLKNPDYIIDNFSKDYNKLQIENKIKNGLYGIEYNFTNFVDYIKQNLDVRIANIIIERYSGKTLEFIAQKNGLTRERVRQICKKLKIEEITENLVEDAYRGLFEKYDWDKKSFCELFQETEVTFNYLNERYVKGTESLENVLKDDEISDDIKEKYKSLYKTAVTSDGDMISSINEFIKKVLIKYASDEIDVEELTDLYNDEIEKYPELQLNSISARNLEARLGRCDYSIFGANHKVRYYNYDGLSEESINQLKELIIMSDGFYTTEYLFRNNRQLMTEVDIRNENELHNILKNKIDNGENNVYFLRMPNFLVEYKERDDFIIDKIREYSPILINDFVDIMYEEYGHKKGTMLSFLTANFATYIKNGFFDIETIVLNDSQLEPIKCRLKKDIYSLDEIKDILFEEGYEDFNPVLTNKNLFKMGYKMRGSYAVKNEYGGIYGYFDNKIANQTVIKLDENITRIGAVYNAIGYYCRQLKLFQIADNVYITDKKLEQLGIVKDELVNLIKQIMDIFGDKDYFSVNNIISEIDCSKYEELGLSEKFLEDIVFYLEDIKTLRINNNRLFSFTKKNMSISNFMYDMINKYSSISLDDLEKEIMLSYQINVPFDKLRGYLYGTDIFYSDILGKIYSDKNNYYEEVYDE